jgi:hypothetical protein
MDRQDHKVLTYVEYRAVSGVFQNIDLPPPSSPSECVFPRTKAEAGKYTLAGRWGGWGVNILEDARHRIGLLQYNLSTGKTDTMLVKSRKMTVWAKHCHGGWGGEG